MVMERGWNHNTEISPNCPRCGSCNTKFCYYNNYSLTQPRYFCKACRRYWTKGGSLRNVPVGGGCRKTRRHTSKTLRVLHSALPSRNNNPAHHHHHHHAHPSAASDHAPHIDLALIYSNFLNQSPDSSDREPHHQFMKTLGFDPCPWYSSLSDMVFGLSEPSTMESHFNHHVGGLFNSMQEHREGRIIGTDNFELPPLPGEELLASQYDHMSMWSESHHHDEMMVVNQAPLLAAQPHHVNGSWGAFHYSTNVSFPSL